MSDDEEYKKRRERNNISVQMCRQKEKEKIEKAKKDVEQFKQENKTLKEKYESLERELKMLKSLFNDQSSTETTSISINNDNLSLQSLLQSQQSAPSESTHSEKQASQNNNTPTNLKTIKKPTTRRRESTANKFKNEVLLKEIKKSSSTSSLSQLLNSDRKPSLGNDMKFQSQEDNIREEIVTEAPLTQTIFFLQSEQDNYQTSITLDNVTNNSALTIPMPFHHEYAFSTKNLTKKN